MAASAVYPPYPDVKTLPQTSPPGSTMQTTKSFSIDNSDNSASSIQTKTTSAGRHDEAESLGCCACCLYFISTAFFVLTFPISCCFLIKIVNQYERAVIFRLGQLTTGGAKGPGLFFINPCTDVYRKVDMRTVSFDVPPQEILTKDSVTVKVDAVVYFRVADAVVAIVNVARASESTKLLAQSTLRTILGTKTLTELLTKREIIREEIRKVLDEATDAWGIKVERVEIKDAKLPVEMQRVMAAEAEADREAKAKVIAAEGEKSASMALRDAALTIAQSPAALQLRYLQTLNTISAERNSTIVFPFPVDFFSAMLGNRQQPPQQQQSYQPIPGVSVPNESSNEASSTFLHTARTHLG